jgi:hypothetical protein
MDLLPMQQVIRTTGQTRRIKLTFFGLPAPSLLPPAACPGVFLLSFGLPTGIMDLFGIFKHKKAKGGDKG